MLAADRRRLARLLWLDPTSKRSEFDRLKSSAKAATLGKFKLRLAHLQALDELGATERWLDGIPATKIAHFAGEARVTDVGDMRDVGEAKRWTLLASLIHECRTTSWLPPAWRWQAWDCWRSVWVHADTGYGNVWWRLGVVGIGFALTMSPLTGAAIQAVSPQEGGLASGISSTTRQIGAVLGVAVLGAIVRTRQSGGASFETGLNSAFLAAGTATLATAVFTGLWLARSKPAEGSALD